MTEEEAKTKTKWCPFTRVFIADGNNWQEIGNRMAEADADNEFSFANESKCIGSECMAWRATDNEFLPEPDPAMTTAVHVPQKGKPAGYCGLAGKP